MSLAALRFLAMIIGPSIMAVARPAATFFAVQLVVAALVHQELATLPNSLAWLITVPAFVIVAVLVGLETVIEHDPDFAAILRELHVDNLTGAFGALTAALLFAALGMPEAEAAALIDGGTGSMDSIDNGGILGATAGAASTDHSPALQAGAVGGALVINLGLSWLRSQILAFVTDFELGTLWARLETGGVVGLLILLPLLPLLTFGFLIFFAAALTAMALAVRAAKRAMDHRFRTDCSSCGHALRVEASLCPNCKTPRQPSAPPTSGIKAAYATLRRA